MRHLAKKISGSPVTEAIDNPKTLAQIAAAHPEVLADYVHCHTQEHYYHTLRQSIDNNLAPIVFFDVDPNTANPGLFDGQNEHAAIVTEYAYSDGKITFNLINWQKDTKVDGDALFKSTRQLRQEKPAKHYRKYPNREDGGGSGWLPEEIIVKFEALRDEKRFSKDLNTYPLRISPASSITNNHGGLRNKVLLIAPKTQGDLIQYLKKPWSGISDQFGSAFPKKLYPTEKWIGWAPFALRLAALVSLCAITNAFIVLILNAAVLNMPLFIAPYILGIALLSFTMTCVLLAKQNQIQTYPLDLTLTAHSPASGETVKMGSLQTIPVLSPITLGHRNQASDTLEQHSSFSATAS